MPALSAALCSSRSVNPFLQLALAAGSRELEAGCCVFKKKCTTVVWCKRKKRKTCVCCVAFTGDRQLNNSAVLHRKYIVYRYEASDY